MRKALLATMLVLVPVTALQAMTVATFLEKADGLQRRGFTALFSSDYRLLKGEVVTATGQLREERLAAQRAGRRPAYCPPASPSLGSNEILAAFRTIPPAQRGRVDVRDALRSLLAHKYPCA